MPETQEARLPPEEARGRSAFDLSDSRTPPPAQAREQRGEPNQQEVLGKFKQAIDLLVEVARVSPRLAPLVVEFIQKVGQLGQEQGGEQPPAGAAPPPPGAPPPGGAPPPPGPPVRPGPYTGQ